MIAYKAFNKDLTAYGGFVYEVDKQYIHPTAIDPRHSGFHAYSSVDHVFDHYSYDTSVVYKVKLSGDIVKDGNLVVSSQIKLIQPFTGLINVHDKKTYWLKDGVLHRGCNLPAVKDSILGYEEWYKDGLLHREDNLPAVVYSDGTQKWYVLGNLIRDGGLPAIEWGCGIHNWFLNNKLHREDGLPAVVRDDGSQEYYKNGIKYTP